MSTPNLDALCRAGIRYSRAACNSPLCAPSRNSLAAGKYPGRLGALNNEVSFPPDQPSYYQTLRREGYRVGVVGKTDLHKPWHTYGAKGDLPLMYHLGFTDILEAEGKMAAAKTADSGKIKQCRIQIDKLDKRIACPVARNARAPHYERHAQGGLVHDLLMSIPLDVDGRSFAQTLRDEGKPHKSWLFSELEHTRMIFDGRYKWIDNPGDMAELYDLAEDPDELVNLAKQRPDEAARLESLMSTVIKGGSH